MLKLHKYHAEYHGVVTVVIVNEGRKWIHYVTIDSPVAMRKARLVERKFFRELAQVTTLEAFMAVANRLGITEGARRALLGVQAS